MIAYYFIFRKCKNLISLCVISYEWYIIESVQDQNRLVISCPYVNVVSVSLILTAFVKPLLYAPIFELEFILANNAAY